MLEDINLSEEQDNRCSEEPSRVDDGFEENERFHHLILCPSLTSGNKNQETGAPDSFLPTIPHHTPTAQHRIELK
jgi:hypothetical protein